MGQVLYRKYRSKNLAEIIGQEHITKTLEQALKTGRISHAYLFSGPRGVGKTSIARIMAHEINQIAYEDDKPNIDIIEIDAASNRRIDEIRDLRDKVHITPTSSKYKVYIIDEVHMLTKEAFNALLKTLEEPPAHVVFILATTDAHKLPDTIISRTQRFNFKPVDKKLVINHLKEIAKKEKIDIDQRALGIIAEHGEGSFRDSISLLDQLGSSSTKVTEDDVLRLLGIPGKDKIANIIKLIEAGSSSLADLNNLLNDLYALGYSAPAIAKALMNQLRNSLVTNQLNMPLAQALELLKDLIEVEPSSDPNSYLIISLMSHLTDSGNKPPAIVSQEVDPIEDVKKPKVAKLEVAKEKQVAEHSVWPKVLNELKKSNNTLYGIVRMATPAFIDNNKIDLVFDFAFHQKRVNDSKNKQTISAVLKELTGENFVIECRLDSSKNGKTIEAVLPQEEIATIDDTDLQNINKIFGSSEKL